MSLYFLYLPFSFLCLYINICYGELKDMFSSQLKDSEISCNYGIKRNESFPFCDCSNVIGNGTYCEISSYNNNIYSLVVVLCLKDNSQLWKKNLEVQFPKSTVITEENNKYAKGFVKHISFEIYYFCAKPDKKMFEWPRLKKVYTSQKEEVTTSYGTEQIYLKDYYYGDRIAWIILLVLVLILLIYIFGSKIPKTRRMFHPLIKSNIQYRLPSRPCEETMEPPRPEERELPEESFGSQHIKRNSSENFQDYENLHEDSTGTTSNYLLQAETSS